MTTPSPSTLGALRATDHVYKPVRVELRDNLVRRLRAGEQTFPGIIGFQATVVPEVERALLAGHDFVLLGERGQGKTRLIRMLSGLLDEWSPVVAGCEINDHPYLPACRSCQALVAAQGDQTPVAWRHRDERYGEKLATPDTSVGDLIGDVDPIKVAEGRTLGDPETVHYGLVPRTNRGIFSINELPDLAERIQVSLLNVLEERDIQVRGYQLRLPLDLLVVASANPEDYTNRGRIISPLKDRFGAEVRTHYPLDLVDEMILITQEAELLWDDDGEGFAAPLIPEHLFEVIARFTREVREAPQIDARSGVSARFGIAAIETVAAAAVRRAALTGERNAVARVCDLASIVPASRGKVEFEDAEEGRELDILEHLLRRAIAQTFRAQLAGVDLSGLQHRFDEGTTVQTGDLVPGTELLSELGPVPGLAQILYRLGIDEGVENPGLVAASVEFAMEGLHLNRRLAKERVDGHTLYGG